MVVRGARIRGREGLWDVGVRGGRIVEVSRRVGERGEEEFEAGGRLLAPNFFDMHIHLDSVLTLGDPRHNESGTLLEGIEIWSERRERLGVEEALERMREAVYWMVSNGTTYLRTHIDCTAPTDAAAEAVLRLREEVGDIMDIQVTAFPQSGILTDEGNVEMLERAVERWADNVGMIPHIEFTREDGVRSIEIAFELAKRYGKPIDGHVDETDDEHSRFLEVVAAKTIREKMFGRVSASHVTASHGYNGAYLAKLYRMLRRAEVTIIANPLINIHLQGRFDTLPKRRGMAPIKEMAGFGVNVALGHDCVMDPWFPLGIGSMLHALYVAVLVGHMTGYGELKRTFDLITVNAAKAYGVTDYGIEAGSRADFQILDGRDELEVLARLRPPLYVFKNGKLVCENTKHETKIHNNGKTVRIDPGKVPYLPD